MYLHKDRLKQIICYKRENPEALNIDAALARQWLNLSTSVEMVIAPFDVRGIQSASFTRSHLLAEVVTRGAELLMRRHVDTYTFTGEGSGGLMEHVGFRPGTSSQLTPQTWLSNHRHRNMSPGPREFWMILVLSFQ